MMKYILLTLCSVILSLELYAQENQLDAQGRKHGVWKKYYPNKQLRYEGSFNHGVEVDTFFFYFEDGGLKAKNYFPGGGRTVSWQYGGDNQLAAHGEYLNGKREGEWLFYDIDGNLLSSEQYVDDLRNGRSTIFFDNGKKAEVSIYKEDIKDGEWQQFYENGKPKAKGTYVNGSLHGEASYFYTNGKLRMKGQYVRGKMHGTWYFFDPYMKVDHKEEWRYGIRQDKEEKKEEVEENSEN